MKKRMTAFILAALMVLMLLPVTVGAADDPADEIGGGAQYDNLEDAPDVATSGNTAQPLSAPFAALAATTYDVSDIATLTNALSNVVDGDIIRLTENIDYNVSIVIQLAKPSPST